MRKLYLKIFFFLTICLLITLSACSNSSTSNTLNSSLFHGGIFYHPSFTYSDGTPIEIYTFYEDGTGIITTSSSEYNFSWDEKDGYIMTSQALSLSSAFKYQNGYLIEPLRIWDGEIPDGDTFDATVSLNSTTYPLSLIFSKSGNVIYSTGVDEQTLTYTRSSDTITFGSMRYIVIDKHLCSGYLAPYLEDNDEHISL